MANSKSREAGKVTGREPARGQPKSAAKKRTDKRPEREPAPPPWGNIVTENGFHGSSAATKWRALFWELHAAKEAGETAATFAGERLDAVLFALETAIHFQEEILPRTFLAFAALSGDRSEVARLRTFANRVRGLPDRHGRQATFDAALVMCHYLSLIGVDTPGEPSLLIFKTWRELRIESPANCRPDGLPQAPLDRKTAVRVVTKLHNFQSDTACIEFLRSHGLNDRLRKAGLPLLPHTRP